MKTSLLLLFLLISPVWERPAVSQEEASAEAEIRSIMAQARQASVEGDSKKIASLIADEYLQTDISGHVQDKSTWLKQYFDPIAELIRAGKFRWELYERKDVQIHTFGNSAVVIGALEAKGTGARWMPQSQSWSADPNATFSGTLRFTHVYIKRDGKWLLVALHNAVPVSPLPSK
jgi:ketosteroid isomerase-like protein